MRLGARARLRGLLELHGLTDAAPCIDIKNDGGPAGCRLPVARMSLTPPSWTLPAVPLGTHAAEWLPVTPEIRGEVPLGQRPR